MHLRGGAMLRSRLRHFSSSGGRAVDTLVVSLTQLRLVAKLSRVEV